ncbi:hypothetical protein [Neorhizobium petrolearium]|uniref:hypothetical protein n=1 Tax=Neorhizobium petrolearium TaxID=515361 RepID=UPI003F13D8F2
MLAWLTSNEELLNLIANWAMVAIWVVYLQIFLRSFKRQTLPKIVINRAAGSSLEASCFVSNMSPEPIYIESVVVELVCGELKFAAAVTDFDPDHPGNSGADPKQRTYQGPLAPSAYTSLGTFQYLLDTLSDRTGCNIECLKSSQQPMLIEISILADYASERLLIGAKRTFITFCKDERWKLNEEALETQQLRSNRERRRLRTRLATLQ